MYPVFITGPTGRCVAHRALRQTGTVYISFVFLYISLPFIKTGVASFFLNLGKDF